MNEEEEAGGWVKDILCWDNWDGSGGMAWTKGSNGGRDALVLAGWIFATAAGTTEALGACFRLIERLYKDTK
jgi:hypothetical protein